VRTALVTGSSGGIGSAVVTKLEHSGHHVIGVDIDQSSGRADDMVDLSSWTDCVAVARRLAPVDVLINNAAMLVELPSEDITKAEFDAVISVNLVAPFLLMRELVPGMAERGFGRVVNIASVACRTGGTRVTGVYAASKAGLVSLTKNFAREYSARGVTVNAVAPGAIDTPMSRGQMSRDEALERRILAQLPVGRLGTPVEVAALVSFLASDDASFVTGTTIDVNGGLVMY